MNINVNLNETEQKMLKQLADFHKNKSETLTPLLLITTSKKTYHGPNELFAGKEYTVVIEGETITKRTQFENDASIVACIKQAIKKHKLSEKEKIELLEEITYQLEEFLPDSEIEIYEPICVTIHIHYYSYKPEPVAYFFTQREAEEYIKTHKETLNKPTIAVISAGEENKGDIPVFQALLARMGNSVTLQETPIDKERLLALLQRFADRACYLLSEMAQAELLKSMGLTNEEIELIGYEPHPDETIVPF